MLHHPEIRPALPQSSIKRLGLVHPPSQSVLLAFVVRSVAWFERVVSGADYPESVAVVVVDDGVAEFCVDEGGGGAGGGVGEEGVLGDGDLAVDYFYLGCLVVFVVVVVVVVVVFVGGVRRGEVGGERHGSCRWIIVSLYGLDILLRLFRCVVPVGPHERRAISFHGDGLYHLLFLLFLFLLFLHLRRRILLDLRFRFLLRISFALVPLAPAKPDPLLLLLLLYVLLLYLLHLLLHLVFLHLAILAIAILQRHAPILVVHPPLPPRVLGNVVLLIRRVLLVVKRHEFALGRGDAFRISRDVGVKGLDGGDWSQGGDSLGVVGVIDDVDGVLVFFFLFCLLFSCSSFLSLSFLFVVVVVVFFLRFVILALVVILRLRFRYRSTLSLRFPILVVVLLLVLRLRLSNCRKGRVGRIRLPALPVAPPVILLVGGSIRVVPGSDRRVVVVVVVTAPRQ
mmetsp:Transcript_22976/g.41013  ORF Transcript_22976/g.41013 Transcript_22976/m.41013 type:complete len:453 (-) Transcript_22976:589-1947(-)